MSTYIIILGSFLAMIRDLKERKIPNKLLAPLFAYQLVYLLVIWDLKGLGVYLLSILIVGGVLLIPFACHQMGAGDVKLLAICGGYFGFTNLNIYIYIGLMGGILALLVMVLRQTQVLRVKEEWKTIPYAVPIFLGTVLYQILEVGSGHLL